MSPEDVVAYIDDKNLYEHVSNTVNRLADVKLNVVDGIVTCLSAAITIAGQSNPKTPDVERLQRDLMLIIAKVLEGST